MPTVFTVYKGDTWTWVIPLLDEDASPITSIGNVWISIYSDLNTEVLTYELSDSEITFGGGDDSNEVQLKIPGIDTDDIEPGTYFFDVKAENSAGDEITVIFRDVIRVRKGPLYDDH